MTLPPFEQIFAGSCNLTMLVSFDRMDQCDPASGMGVSTYNPSHQMCYSYISPRTGLN